MPYIQIKPHSSFFLGSNKPFNMGEVDWTDSLLLPRPSTLFGAIFSILYNKYPQIQDKVLDEKQEIEPTDYLEIENIYLYNKKNGRVLIPAPLDLFIGDDKIYNEDYISDIITSYNIKKFEFVVPNTDNDAKRAENYFIDISYLGEIPSELYSFTDFATIEPKVGIAIDRSTKTTKESMLYRINLTQFIDENWTFLVEYKTKDVVLNQSGIIKLGGEGKFATYSHIEEPITITNHNQKLQLKKEDEFKIYFSTPAIFEKGWIFAENEKFEILSASIGKHIFIGGFDMKKRKAKTMYKAIPSGSIYLIKINQKVSNIEELKEILSIQSIDSKRGFGKFEILNVIYEED